MTSETGTDLQPDNEIFVVPKDDTVESSDKKVVKSKKPMDPERKAQMLENLRKGREAAKAKRKAKKETEEAVKEKNREKHNEELAVALDDTINNHDDIKDLKAQLKEIKLALEESKKSKNSEIPEFKKENYSNNVKPEVKVEKEKIIPKPVMVKPKVIYSTYKKSMWDI